LLDLQEDSERILGSDALRKVFIQRFEDYAVKKKEYDATSNAAAQGMCLSLVTIELLKPA
jgi:hypothetical protein